MLNLLHGVLLKKIDETELHLNHMGTCTLDLTIIQKSAIILNSNMFSLQYIFQDS